MFSDILSTCVNRVIRQLSSAEELEEQKSADAQDEEQSFELEEMLQTREAQLSGLMSESELEDTQTAFGEKTQSQKSPGMEYGG